MEKISNNKHKNTMVWLSCIKEHLFKVWNVFAMWFKCRKVIYCEKKHIQLVFSHLFDHESILISLSNWYRL